MGGAAGYASVLLAGLPLSYDRKIRLAKMFVTDRTVVGRDAF